MAKRRDAVGGGLWLASALAFTWSSAGAQTLTVEHRPVSCAVAERFPRLEAQFRPTESVARARIVFQGANSQEWYSVDMKAEDGLYSGVLPKPRASLKAFVYYIEVIGDALGTSRTPEYTAAVVDGASLCQGGATAGALASASVMLHGPAGVVSLPAGFASSGVTLAGAATGSSTGAGGAAATMGGGLSGAGLVGIVAGAGAAVGVAVAAGGGDSNAPSPSGPVTSPPSAPPSPSPSPTPLACPACYAGQWRLQATITAVGNPPLCENRPADVGKIVTVAPISINPDGGIVFPPGEEGSGSVDAQGNLVLNFTGDPPGSGLTCPAGQGTGRCTTPNTCTGSVSQGGDIYAISLDRQ